MPLPHPLTSCRHAFALALVVACAAAAGCATFQAPTWPWAKTNAPPAADDESTVLSSEYAPADTEFGLDAFKGDNIKKRWKKMVGRGPDEEVAREALAAGDALFREGRYAAAIPKYKVAIDRWPDSALEEDAMWQLA
jgi:hypothetical protein